MDKQKVNTKIDSAADQAAETMALFSEKLDQATVCATQMGRKVKNTAKEGVLKATDRIEEAITTAADRVREKVHK